MRNGLIFVESQHDRVGVKVARLDGCWRSNLNENPKRAPGTADDGQLSLEVERRSISETAML